MTDTDSVAFDADTFLKTLTQLPGVYRMLNNKGQILYVGKARNLKKRVASYFRAQSQSVKLQRLMAQTRSIEVTVTHTENEALLLESTLIKTYKPPYNVLLRDDKSYPYVHLSEGDFPRLSMQRGAKRSGRYFGPYPDAVAVRETVQLLQRFFRLRPCEDSVFQHRTRPCLQYQIKRCSGPCVGLMSPLDYQQDVVQAVAFLQGKSNDVINNWVQRMETASRELRFEEAAQLRDQIAHLRQIQERQYVSGEGGDTDVIAAVVQDGFACVEVLFFRGGRLIGNKPFFPRLPELISEREIMSAFLAQYYLGSDVPAKIIVDPAPKEAAWLESTLSQQAQRPVQFTHTVPRSSQEAHWLAMARQNAQQALQSQLAIQATLQNRFQALQTALAWPNPLTRLECVDISHTMGEATVAACVVFTKEGPLKSAYRRYRIEAITPGDDVAAMHQVLMRRYKRLQRGEGIVSDILFVDGGPGQVAQAQAVLTELGFTELPVIGIAKGEGRKPGLETLYCPDRHPLQLPPDSAALHLIQQIRDEAHRFAITGHRQRRAKTRKTSALEAIPGIGPRRRQLLLNQFGGLQQLSRAGVDDIAKVPGISRELAQRLYDFFHSH